MGHVPVLDAVYGPAAGWFTITTDGWGLAERDPTECAEAYDVLIVAAGGREAFRLDAHLHTRRHRR